MHSFKKTLTITTFLLLLLCWMMFLLLVEVVKTKLDGKHTNGTLFCCIGYTDKGLTFFRGNGILHPWLFCHVNATSRKGTAAKCPFAVRMATHEWFSNSQRKNAVFSSRSRVERTLPKSTENYQLRTEPQVCECSSNIHTGRRCCCCCSV